MTRSTNTKQNGGTKLTSVYGTLSAITNINIDPSTTATATGNVNNKLSRTSNNQYVLGSP